MNAETFAIIGALAFAAATLTLRRAVLNAPDATVGAVVTTSIGLPFFMLVLHVGALFLTFHRVCQ